MRDDLKPGDKFPDIELPTTTKRWSNCPALFAAFPPSSYFRGVTIDRKIAVSSIMVIVSRCKLDESRDSTASIESLTATTLASY